MLLNNAGNVPYYQFVNLQNQQGILHFVTTWHGGVSTGDCRTLNMDFIEADLIENVRENRRRLALSVGFSSAAYTCAAQTHSDTITMVTKDMRGYGAYDNTNRIPSSDALITDVPDICLLVKHADCVPVLLYDPANNVIATVHAGWRGTVKQIVYKTVGKMTAHFGCSPGNIIAGIGPSIGPCCYEIGEEVEEEFRKSFGDGCNFFTNQHNKSKKHLDLWQANYDLLLQAGINSTNIETANICTSCHSNEFFSWRHDGAATGRLVSGIMLK